MTPFKPSLTENKDLIKDDSWPEAKHRFEDESVKAVRAALASGRPLLLLGEPGIGKSQLARAVAAELEVPFLNLVIDERTERDDLFYRYDAVARVAKAQMLSIEGRSANGKKVDFEKDLAESRFTRPGVFWWAFHWESAEELLDGFFNNEGVTRPRMPDGWAAGSEKCCAQGCSSVVLIDEIDKADTAVPNGLLECLGNMGFKSPHLAAPVSLHEGAAPPLVIITTNRERELPLAFLRRCLVHEMEFPKTEEKAIDLLQVRARTRWTKGEVGDEILREVAQDLWKQRESSKGMWQPGAAEFLDLVKVLVELHSGDEDAQKNAIAEYRQFTFEKLGD